MLTTYEKEVGRLNDGGEPHPERISPLTTPQQQALDSTLSLMQQKNVVLLHGVTSSGKTEIYIHLIQQAIDHGQQVLFLLQRSLLHPYWHTRFW